MRDQKVQFELIKVKSTPVQLHNTHKYKMRLSSPFEDKSLLPCELVNSKYDFNLKRGFARFHFENTPVMLLCSKYINAAPGTEIKYKSKHMFRSLDKNRNLLELAAKDIDLLSVKELKYESKV